MDILSAGGVEAKDGYFDTRPLEEAAYVCRLMARQK